LENCGANGFKFTLNPGIDFEKLIQDGTLKNSDLQVAAGSWSCGTTLETGTNQNGPSGNEQFVPDMFLYTDEACTQQASSNMAYDKTKGLTLYFHKSSSDFSAEERSNLKAMLGTTELTPVWKNDSTYLITIEPNLDLGKRSGDTDLVITAGTSTCCFTLEVPQLLYCYGGNVPESNDQTFEQGRLRPVVSDSFDLKNSGAIKFYYGTIDSNSNVEVTSISSSDPDVMKLTPKSVNGAYWWVCETFSKEDTVTLTYTYGEKPNEVTGTAEVVVSLPDQWFYQGNARTVENLGPTLYDKTKPLTVYYLRKDALPEGTLKNATVTFGSTAVSYQDRLSGRVLTWEIITNAHNQEVGIEITLNSGLDFDGPQNECMQYKCHTG
jgi:hypothetical protein